MKKIFKLENLDCAHCAEKMENAINKLDGVNASINFFASKIVIESDAEDFNGVVDTVQQTISGIEKDCRIVR